jgi:hypothetical protein
MATRLITLALVGYRDRLVDPLGNVGNGFFFHAQEAMIV